MTFRAALMQSGSAQVARLMITMLARDGQPIGVAMAGSPCLGRYSPPACEWRFPESYDQRPEANA